MSKSDHCVGYYTPFQAVSADCNGCIFNADPIYSYRFNYHKSTNIISSNEIGYYYNDSLTSHIVHSYYDKPNGRSLNAYAIGVVAYGYVSLCRTNASLINVGSIALYIPLLDKSKFKRKRINYLKNNEHNILELVNLFPKMKEKKEDFEVLGFKI
jgi:hypothetical protein